MSSLPDEKDVLTDEAKEAEDSGIEIVIEDDTPPEDQGRKPLEEDPEPADAEVEEYSEKVKQRINKMRHGLHDERRAKEAALRERDEAVALTRRIVEEKKALEARNTQGETAYVVQTKERVELALREAKREYREAYEAGDGEKLADAHERVAALTLERHQVDSWARQQKPKESALQPPPVDVQRQLTPFPQVVKAPAPVDADASKWAAKNEWFHKDKVMRAVAFAINDELLADGIDPAEEPSEYYGTIDKRMREVFPSYDWGDGRVKTRPHTTVASVGRTTNTARRVVLTQTQVSLARRLGITPEQYASELAKMEK